MTPSSRKGSLASVIEATLTGRDKNENSRLERGKAASAGSAEPN